MKGLDVSNLTKFIRSTLQMGSVDPATHISVLVDFAFPGFHFSWILLLTLPHKHAKSKDLLYTYVKADKQVLLF